MTILPFIDPPYKIAFLTFGGVFILENRLNEQKKYAAPGT